MKRGQLSIFLIIGLIIIMVLVFINLFYVSFSGKKVVANEKATVDIYLQSCMEHGAEAGIYTLGMFTGHIDGPTRKLIDEGRRVEHSLNSAKQEYRRYLKDMVSGCIQSFPNTNKLNIQQGDPAIDIAFSDTQTTIDFRDVYSYEKGDTRVGSTPFRIKLPVRYKLVHESIDILIDERKSRYIPDSDTLKTPGFDISVVDYNTTTELWVVSDRRSVIMGEPFRYAYFVQLV